MREFVRENDLSTAPRYLLVGGMSAKKLLLATPLLQWYLNHGLVVTKVHKVIESVPMRCFQKFTEYVCDARRKADLDRDRAILGDIAKLIANSAYGGLLLEKSKHTTTTYVHDIHKAKLLINNPRFMQCTDMGDGYYEMQMRKYAINYDLPVQLGFFILAYAKLRMLQFYYDFLDHYISRDHFQLAQMDTDSMYFAICEESILDVIKPDMKDAYLENTLHQCNDVVREVDDTYFLPRECCQKHIAFDKRTAGLFKVEAIGNSMISLNSKTYFLDMDHGHKFSCKGISKRFFSNPKPVYESVVDSKESVSRTNTGFRKRNGTMQTYEQKRQGFTYFYCKRVVGPDGVSTSPLTMTLCPWVDQNVVPFGGESERDEKILEDRHVRLDAVNYFSPDGHLLSSIESVYNYHFLKFHKKDIPFERVNTTYVDEETMNSIAKNMKPRAEWVQKREEVLLEILKEVGERPEHRRWLLSTGDKRLVYCTKDKYFGAGVTRRMCLLVPPSKYIGRNVYGKLWEKVREGLKE